ncbi:hypothetical protein PTKIN_Ptkin08bG0146700 [Pterospermum kingtungense]
MSVAIGTQLGNFVGRFVAYDDKNNSLIWITYMCIRVSIDVRKPLKRKKKVLLRDGKQVFFNFKYEKLSTFSFMCGILGHSEHFCGKLFCCPEGEIKAPSKRTMFIGGDRWLREDGDALGGDDWSAEGSAKVGVVSQRNNNDGVMQRLALPMIGGSSIESGKQKQIVFVTAV